MIARVLVADDEPAITSLIALALDAAGFDVFQAHDGDEAWDIAQNERPDIVLLDVMMPGLDGRDVCRRIKDDPELRHIPVVLFSSLDEQAVDWRGAGADAYLQKVFNILELPRLVERWLRRGRVS